MARVPVRVRLCELRRVHERLRLRGRLLRVIAQEPHQLPLVELDSPEEILGDTPFVRRLRALAVRDWAGKRYQRRDILSEIRHLALQWSEMP